MIYRNKNQLFMENLLLVGKSSSHSINRYTSDENSSLHNFSTTRIPVARKQQRLVYRLKIFLLLILVLFQFPEKLFPT